MNLHPETEPNVFDDITYICEETKHAFLPVNVFRTKFITTEGDIIHSMETEIPMNDLMFQQILIVMNKFFNKGYKNGRYTLRSDLKSLLEID